MVYDARFETIFFYCPPLTGQTEATASDLSQYQISPGAIVAVAALLSKPL